MRIQLEGRPFSKIQFDDLMRKKRFKNPFNYKPWL
jgi:hypothetical protein